MSLANIFDMQFWTGSSGLTVISFELDVAISLTFVSFDVRPRRAIYKVRYSIRVEEKSGGFGRMG